MFFVISPVFFSYCCFTYFCVCMCARLNSVYVRSKYTSSMFFFASDAFRFLRKSSILMCWRDCVLKIVWIIIACFLHTYTYTHTHIHIQIQMLECYFNITDERTLKMHKSLFQYLMNVSYRSGIAWHVTKSVNSWNRLGAQGNKKLIYIYMLFNSIECHVTVHHISLRYAYAKNEFVEIHVPKQRTFSYRGGAHMNKETLQKRMNAFSLFFFSMQFGRKDFVQLPTKWNESIFKSELRRLFILSFCSYEWHLFRRCFHFHVVLHAFMLIVQFCLISN